MRTIHDTITRLAALRSRAIPHLDGEHHRFSEFTSFGSNPGALRARTYIPESYVAGSPLVVVLHGCTQDPSAYDRGAGWSNAADACGFALLFPEQQRANNVKLCFNWFSPDDASRDRGEALSIRQMVDEMHTRCGTDPARVFVTGLSAGGAMAAVMLATYPDVFAGGGIIAGVPFGSAHSIPEAFDRMRGHGAPSPKELTKLVLGASSHSGPWPTLSIWHGSNDMIVDAGNAQDLVDQWRALHGATKVPTRTDHVEGYPHRVWCDPAGREVIEEYEITGMAHGTPLNTSQPGSGEVAGPYMLQAGISSTRHICRFWGLSDTAARPAGTVRIDRLDDEATPIENPQNRARRRQTLSPQTNVMKTIEDALRSAGLLR